MRDRGIQLASQVRLFGFLPSVVAPFAAGLVAAALPHPARGQEIEALRGMSIEDLQNINVSSVSKTDMPLSGAAAAIYVISRDDIMRSGAATNGTSEAAFLSSRGWIPFGVDDDAPAATFELGSSSRDATRAAATMATAPAAQSRTSRRRRRVSPSAWPGP